MDCFGTFFSTSPNLRLSSCSKCYAMDCFGTYSTHAQTCDYVRVQSATQWTASVHTLHMPKPVITFVFKVLRNGLLRYILFYKPKPVRTYHWFIQSTSNSILMHKSGRATKCWGQWAIITQRVVCSVNCEGLQAWPSRRKATSERCCLLCWDFRHLSFVVVVVLSGRRLIGLDLQQLYSIGKFFHKLKVLCLLKLPHRLGHFYGYRWQLNDDW